MPPVRKSFSSATDTPAANPLAGVTFDVDEVTFRCEGRLSFLDSSDLARRVADLPTTDLDDLRKLDPRQAATVIGSMSSTLLMALGEEEYRRFRQHCRDHATPDDVIVEVMAFVNEAMQASVEEAAGRPTVPPQPSSSGPPETGERISRIVSLQRGDVTVVGEDGTQVPVMQGGQQVKQPAKAKAAKDRGSPPGRRRTA